MSSKQRPWTIITSILIGLLLAGCASQATPPTDGGHTGVTPKPPGVISTAPAQSTPTPAAIQPATPQPPQDPAAMVQAEFSRLAAGRILYNPPEEMTEGERERVEVRITQNMTASLTEGLKGSGAPRIEQIPVASFMKVRLTSDSFDITPVSSEEQIVAGDTYTQWAWDVVPQRSGTHALILVVTARVKLAGFSDEQRDLDIIERTINVRVNPVYSVQSFISNNRDWLFPTVLVPLIIALGGWVWKNYSKRKNSGSETNNPPQ
ncbi:MAG: hypothetical protein WA029_15185 [Anaerolineae bacterium]